VNGLLVPPGDSGALACAIDRILCDPAFAARLGRAARTTIAQRHAPARAIERLDQVYARLGVQRPSAMRALSDLLTGASRPRKLQENP